MTKQIVPVPVVSNPKGLITGPQLDNSGFVGRKAGLNNALPSKRSKAVERPNNNKKTNAASLVTKKGAKAMTSNVNNLLMKIFTFEQMLVEEITTIAYVRKGGQRVKKYTPPSVNNSAQKRRAKASEKRTNYLNKKAPKPQGKRIEIAIGYTSDESLLSIIAFFRKETQHVIFADANDKTIVLAHKRALEDAMREVYDDDYKLFTCLPDFPVYAWLNLAKGVVNLCIDNPPKGAMALGDKENKMRIKANQKEAKQNLAASIDILANFIAKDKDNQELMERVMFAIDQLMGLRAVTQASITQKGNGKTVVSRSSRVRFYDELLDVTPIKNGARSGIQRLLVSREIDENGKAVLGLKNVGHQIVELTPALAAPMSNSIVARAYVGENDTEKQTAFAELQNFLRGISNTLSFYSCRMQLVGPAWQSLFWAEGYKKGKNRGAQNGVRSTAHDKSLYWMKNFVLGGEIKESIFDELNGKWMEVVSNLMGIEVIACDFNSPDSIEALIGAGYIVDGEAARHYFNHVKRTIEVRKGEVVNSEIDGSIIYGAGKNFEGKSYLHCDPRTPFQFRAMPMMTIKESELMDRLNAEWAASIHEYATETLQPMYNSGVSMERIQSFYEKKYNEMVDVIFEKVTDHLDNGDIRTGLFGYGKGLCVPQEFAKEGVFLIDLNGIKDRFKPDIKDTVKKQGFHIYPPCVIGFLQDINVGCLSFSAQAINYGLTNVPDLQYYGDDAENSGVRHGDNVDSFPMYSAVKRALDLIEEAVKEFKLGTGDKMVNLMDQVSELAEQERASIEGKEASSDSDANTIEKLNAKAKLVRAIINHPMGVARAKKMVQNFYRNSRFAFQTEGMIIHKLIAPMKHYVWDAPFLNGTRTMTMTDSKGNEYTRICYEAVLVNEQFWNTLECNGTREVKEFVALSFRTPVSDAEVIMPTVYLNPKYMNLAYQLPNGVGMHPAVIKYILVGDTDGDTVGIIPLKIENMAITDSHVHIYNTPSEDAKVLFAFSFNKTFDTLKTENVLGSTKTAPMKMHLGVVENILGESGIMTGTCALLQMQSVRIHKMVMNDGIDYLLPRPDDDEFAARRRASSRLSRRELADFYEGMWSRLATMIGCFVEVGIMLQKKNTLIAGFKLLVSFFFGDEWVKEHNDLLDMIAENNPAFGLNGFYSWMDCDKFVAPTEASTAEGFGDNDTIEGLIRTIDVEVNRRLQRMIDMQSSMSGAGVWIGTSDEDDVWVKSVWAQRGQLANALITQQDVDRDRIGRMNITSDEKYPGVTNITITGLNQLHAPMGSTIMLRDGREVFGYGLMGKEPLIMRIWNTLALNFEKKTFGATWASSMAAILRSIGEKLEIVNGSTQRPIAWHPDTATRFADMQKLENPKVNQGSEYDRENWGICNEGSGINDMTERWVMYFSERATAIYNEVCGDGHQLFDDKTHQELKEKGTPEAYLYDRGWGNFLRQHSEYVNVISQKIGDAWRSIQPKVELNALMVQRLSNAYRLRNLLTEMNPTSIPWSERRDRVEASRAIFNAIRDVRFFGTNDINDPLTKAFDDCYRQVELVVRKEKIYIPKIEDIDNSEARNLQVKLVKVLMSNTLGGAANISNTRECAMWTIMLRAFLNSSFLDMEGKNEIHTLFGFEEMPKHFLKSFFGRYVDHNITFAAMLDNVEGLTATDIIYSIMKGYVLQYVLDSRSADINRRIKRAWMDIARRFDLAPMIKQQFNAAMDSLTDVEKVSMWHYAQTYRQNNGANASLIIEGNEDDNGASQEEVTNAQETNDDNELKGKAGENVNNKAMAMIVSASGAPESQIERYTATKNHGLNSFFLNTALDVMEEKGMVSSIGGEPVHFLSKNVIARFGADKTSTIAEIGKNKPITPDRISILFVDGFMSDPKKGLWVRPMPKMFNVGDEQINYTALYLAYDNEGKTNTLVGIIPHPIAQRVALGFDYIFLDSEKTFIAPGTKKSAVDRIVSSLDKTGRTDEELLLEAQRRYVAKDFGTTAGNVMAILENLHGQVIVDQEICKEDATEPTVVKVTMHPENVHRRLTKMWGLTLEDYVVRKQREIEYLFLTKGKVAVINALAARGFKFEMNEVRAEQIICASSKDRLMITVTDSGVDVEMIGSRFNLDDYHDSIGDNVEIDNVQEDVLDADELRTRIIEYTRSTLASAVDNCLDEVPYFIAKRENKMKKIGIISSDSIVTLNDKVRSVVKKAADKGYTFVLAGRAKGINGEFVRYMDANGFRYECVEGNNRQERLVALDKACGNLITVWDGESIGVKNFHDQFEASGRKALLITIKDDGGNDGGNDPQESLPPQSIAKAKPTTVGWHSDENALYIGREYKKEGLKTSKWANPYPLHDRNNIYERRQVIHRYWNECLSQNQELLAQVGEVQGLHLGCWCGDKPICHGHIIAALADGFAWDKYLLERDPDFYVLEPPKPKIKLTAIEEQAKQFYENTVKNVAENGAVEVKVFVKDGNINISNVPQFNVGEEVSASLLAYIGIRMAHALYDGIPHKVVCNNRSAVSWYLKGEVNTSATMSPELAKIVNGGYAINVDTEVQKMEGLKNQEDIDKSVGLQRYEVLKESIKALRSLRKRGIVT